jgi:hypothetical protein
MERYRNAKAFWKSTTPPFSYEYYSNIERGTKYPNIETVLFLAEKLGMNQKKACFLWAQEAMPTPEAKAFFKWDDAIMDNSVPLGSQITLEQTYLISDAHKKLLENSPLYWEVLSFFAMHEDQFFSLQEVLASLDMPKNSVLKILGELVKHNLLKYERKRYAHPKTYMHIPNDKNFFKLRNMNFQHATKQLLHAIEPQSIAKEQAFRTTINKKFTPGQVNTIVQKCKLLISELLNMQSPLQKDQGLPYTFCLLLSERNFKKRTNK